MPSKPDTNMHSYLANEDFFDGIFSGTGSPEKNLLASVMLRALSDWAGEALVPPFCRREANAWLLSECAHVFSCNWVLDELGLLEQKQKLLAQVKLHGIHY